MQTNIFNVFQKSCQSKTWKNFYYNIYIKCILQYSRRAWWSIFLQANKNNLVQLYLWFAFFQKSYFSALSMLLYKNQFACGNSLKLCKQIFLMFSRNLASPRLERIKRLGKKIYDDVWVIYNLTMSLIQ